jgi:rhodanese-related sulfurtransferase
MIEQVHPRDLAAWLLAVAPHGKPLVLDVREPHEWQFASIRAEGFEMLTLPMRAVPVRMNELDPGRPIACLCHHGGRSMQVASFLKHHGFAHVANIAGGIDAWSREVDPTVPRY